MKRKLCLLMAILMLFSVVFSLASCKKDDGEGEGTTAATTTVPGGEGGGGGGADLYADLPTGDYGGYTFKFLNNESNYANTTIVPADTEESIDNAIFTRNSYVKDLLKIDIVENRMGYTEVQNTYKAIAIGGGFEYDAVYNEIVFQTPLSQLGAYLSTDAYDDLLNFDKPWWFTEAMDSLKVDDVGFDLFSDIQLMYYDSIWGIAFNQKILTDNGQTFPYDLVREGEWTIDVLQQLITNTTDELNTEDNYGMVSHKDFISTLICGSDYVLVRQGEDNPLEMYNDESRLLEVYDKIRRAFFTSNGDGRVNWILADYASSAYVTDFSKGKEEYPGSFQEIFWSGDAAFMSGTIGDIQMARKAEFNYGILPIPKYSDTDQDQYISNVYRGAASMGVPSSTPDLERTCVILENLAAYSHKLILPEYYDIVLQGRSVRDNDSIEMLDIIFGHNDLGTTRFEIDTVYECGISAAIRKTMSDNLPSPVGEIDGKKNVITGKIDTIVQSYKS